jgi:hypothetical protein
MTPNTITLRGTVEKLIDRSLIQQPQQAQISFKGAEFLYDEIRILNTQGWEVGKSIELTIRSLG